MRIREGEYSPSIFRIKLTAAYAKEDFQTEYKALEDRDSSNLYIQGFQASDPDSVGEPYHKAHLIPMDFLLEQAIWRLLERFGEIKSWKRLKDETNKPKGPVMARSVSIPGHVFGADWH